MAVTLTTSVLLSEIVAELASEPLWRGYAECFALRDRGLREEALHVAAEFAASTREWIFEERKRFVLWFMRRTGWFTEQCGGSRFTFRGSNGGMGMFAPHILNEFVVRPTLRDWSLEEPANPEPHFWFALYSDAVWQHLNEALRLVPSYGPACTAHAEMTLLAIKQNQHELPSGYLNDGPESDLMSLDGADAFLCSVDDPLRRDALHDRAVALREIAEDWIRLRESIKGTEWHERSAIWRNRRQ